MSPFAFTKADPVIVGMIEPASSRRYAASNTVPITLSCRQIWPGESFPSAEKKEQNEDAVPIAELGGDTVQP